VAQGKKGKPVSGILFYSSSEIYGDPSPDAIPTPETYRGNVSCTGPRACYDESKRLGETISTIYHQQFKVPVKIVRPFNVFGPGMKHNDRRVIPMFTYQALNRRPLPVHGDGRQERHWLHVMDHCAGIDTVLRKGAHMAEYGLLWFLWWRALGYGHVGPAIAITLLWAASDEFHQSFVEGRHGTPWDVAIDAVGVGLAVLVARVAYSQPRSVA